MELLHKKTEMNCMVPENLNIRWLAADEHSIFREHLELCGQKPFPEAAWNEAYDMGIIYCGFFVDGKMAGRACVEKYSQSAWEVADVRVAKPYRNRGYAYQLCCFVLAYILSQGKTATIRTEEDNIAMQKVIQKIGFERYQLD